MHDEPADWNVSGLFAPNDGGLGISGHFAGELDHFSFEFGRIVRTFEDARLGADDETR